MINGANDFGPFTEFRYTGKIRVIFQSGNRVTGVETTGRGDRTARNEGVGSRLAAVRNQVAGVSCMTIPNGRLCQTGTAAAGQRVTSFFIRNGRVTRIGVAFVID
ncbi:MAG TPA: hypothetical protein VK307_01515 [Thermoleophilaceae bacterium]|nr:hypothetical protein [Thermoleophilaceae bacterium]